MIPGTMHAADAAGDYLRLVEHYRQMKDPELLVLLKQSGELTEFARQVLETEVNHRRLQPESEPEEPATPEPSDWSDPSVAPSETEPLYKEERELVDLCTVWSPRDALQVQRLLDVASIPFFMGPEKVTGVADVTSNFSNGVTVKIMRIGLPWAVRSMKNYFPKDEPPEEAADDMEELSVRCPKCQSNEVVFNGLATDSPPNDESEFPPATADSKPSSAADIPPKFDWTCDACGYEWKDDGVVKE
jgi:DNA-directed RNA polymerase subunit M/transcription elongation factor TFIIS